MMFLLLAACEPDNSLAAPDDVQATLTLSDGRTLEGAGPLQLVDAVSASSAELCGDAVEATNAAFAAFSLFVDLPAWTAGAGARSEDVAVLSVEDREYLYGTLTLTALEEDRAELALTDGVTCTLGDEGETCVAVGATLTLAGAPQWLDLEPFSTAPGAFVDATSSAPLCTVLEWDDPAAADE